MAIVYRMIILYMSAPFYLFRTICKLEQLGI